MLSFKVGQGLGVLMYVCRIIGEIRDKAVYFLNNIIESSAVFITEENVTMFLLQIVNVNESI